MATAQARHNEGGQARAAPDPLAALHPVAMTALVYLQEALRAERYEECAGLIVLAKEFGAPELEIYALLVDPRRALRAQLAAHALGFK